MKKRIRFISLLLTMVMVLSLTLLTGCGKNDSDDVVVTISDEEVSLNEAMYYIYMIEGNYGQFMDKDSWDSILSEDKTFGEMMKEYTMEGLIDSNIMYLEGAKAGITISADDETQLKIASVDLYNSMSDEVVEITGLDEQSIYDISAKSYIGAMHQETLINSFEIDLEELQAEYDREELRQYDTEYLHIPFVSTDAEGNQTSLTDEEKANALETLQKALVDIEGGKTFDEVSEEKEEIISSSVNFVIEDGTISPIYESAAITLENDKTTEEIVETEDGYYIIKMINNNSDERYNSTISNAFSVKQQDMLREKIDELKANYTITINDEIWEPIQLGKTTINLDSDDDTEETESEETGSEETEPAADGDTSGETDATEANDDETTE